MQGYETALRGLIPIPGPPGCNPGLKPDSTLKKRPNAAKTLVSARGAVQNEAVAGSAPCCGPVVIESSDDGAASDAFFDAGPETLE